MKRRIIVGLGAVALGVGAVAAPASAASTSTSAAATPAKPVVVVSGLNNPRQLAWGPHGLLVAEAGRGSLHPGKNNCFAGPEGQTCVGATGSVSLIAQPGLTHNARPHRIVTGLLSGAAPDGGSATGSDGVDAQNGSVLIQQTYFPVQLPHGLPAWQNGKLLAARHGRLSSVANIAKVELTRNPDGLQVDSDPYAVLALGRHSSLTADAAANDLILVRHGKARPFTVFPLHGCGGHRDPNGCDQESVPTSLARGPGNAIYVGELAHFEPGEARVWKVSATTGKILGYYGKGGTICPSDQTGFTTVTGVQFGRDGSLYVSELLGGANGQGDIVKIAPDCTRTSMAVPLPAGLALDRHNNVYVSAFSLSDTDGAVPQPGAPALPPGQVWRVRF
jgi:hypothetical protein